MRLSPLQLVHSQFTAISVISNDISQLATPSVNMPYPLVTEKDIQAEIMLGLPDETSDPHDFAVMVGVSNSEEISSTFPYRFVAQIEGVFRFDHVGEIEERKRMVVINGASMLYGIVREQILNLTIRQKNGPLLLPSLDFRVLAEETQKGKTRRGRRASTNKP